MMKFKDWNYSKLILASASPRRLELLLQGDEWPSLALELGPKVAALFAGRRFDFDDIGAKVAEERGPVRAC